MVVEDTSVQELLLLRTDSCGPTVWGLVLTPQHRPMTGNVSYHGTPPGVFGATSCLFKSVLMTELVVQCQQRPSVHPYSFLKKVESGSCS